jgi:HEAT repeat protein
MEFEILTIAVATLYGVSTALIVFAFLRRWLEIRHERLHERRVEALRSPFEARFLELQPLPPLGRGERDALLDLALRYVGVVRGSAADRILECLQAHGIAAQLIRRLGSRNDWRRAEAAEMLGRLRLRRAVGALLIALEDDSEDVRTAAARSLAAIGDPSAVPPLARALADPSRWTLSLVAENLMVMGPEAVPPLLGMLGGDDHNVRVSAVQILGEIRDPVALPAIIGVLAGDPDLNLRAQAAAALGKLGGSDAQKALLEALEDREWQVRAQAAKALGRIGHPGAAHALARTMPDRSWWVRVNCAEALACLGADGRRQLESLLDHPDRYVREQAASVRAIYGVRGSVA